MERLHRKFLNKYPNKKSITFWGPVISRQILPSNASVLIILTLNCTKSRDCIKWLTNKTQTDVDYFYKEIKGFYDYVTDTLSYYWSVQWIND